MCKHIFYGNTAKKTRNFKGISCGICNDFRKVSKAFSFVFSDWDLNKFTALINNKKIMSDLGVEIWMTTDLEYLRNIGMDEMDGFTSFHTMKYENLKSEINTYVWNQSPVTINQVKEYFDITRRLAKIILDELTFQGYMEDAQTIHSKISAYQTIYPSDE